MKLTYLLAILLLVVTSVGAQQKRDTIHHAASAKKTKMKDAVGLNKQQAATVKAAKTDYKKEKEKIKNDPNLSAKEKDEKISKIKADKNKKVDATLTPAQQEKVKALKAEKKKEKKKKKDA
ncbi:MAG: hypothetical protein ABIU63_00285 [Chitinophagaceae bacterium]